MRRGLKIFFDGGCRGADAMMEIAVVVAGRATIRRDLGPGTSGEAEWQALIAALTLAKALGAADAVLVGDSADVVAKANGRLRCRTYEAAYLARVRALASGTHSPRIRWVRRAQNLAGIALAAQSSRTSGKP